MSTWETRRRQNDNTVRLKETECEGDKWIYLGQDVAP